MSKRRRLRLFQRGRTGFFLCRTLSALFVARRFSHITSIVFSSSQVTRHLEQIQWRGWLSVSNLRHGHNARQFYRVARKQLADVAPVMSKVNSTF